MFSQKIPNYSHYCAYRGDTLRERETLQLKQQLLRSLVVIFNGNHFAWRHLIEKTSNLHLTETRFGNLKVQNSIQIFYVS